MRPRRPHGAELLSHMRQKFGVAGNDHYDSMPSTVPRWHRGFSPVKQSNGESEASDFLMPWILLKPPNCRPYETLSHMRQSFVWLGPSGSMPISRLQSG